MNTEIIKVINEDNLRRAAKIVQCGGLVAFPTETVYGLGASGLDSAAAIKIYAAKGRPQDNPLIIHISNIDDIQKYCYTSPLFYVLADKFMPGALTIILPKKSCIPYEVTGGLNTVAVRYPSNKIAQTLISYAGIPIAAPSANLSGKPSPTTAQHVIDDLNGRIDMIIDGGDCTIGLESTVVKIDDDKIILLRPGAVTFEDLCIVYDNVIIDKVVSQKVADDIKPISPGMKYRHYSPKAEVVILDGTTEKILDFIRIKQQSENCGVLCYDEDKNYLDSKNLLTIGKENDLDTQAHKLFMCLRDFDKIDVDVIYARLPHKDGIGLAVYNRLVKASGFKIINVNEDGVLR